jgi:endogenous inhibitor of DNA gyrase (YacG/DUF329 family)
MAESEKGTGDLPRRARPCPICGKPAVPEFFPFCSKRCADIDLNRWLSGGYSIPVKPEEEEDETPDEKKVPKRPSDDDEGSEGGAGGTGRGRLN